jgi:hypothetical protein
MIEMTIPIDRVGRILSGDESGWYVKVMDDDRSTGGLLILTSRTPDFHEGFDNWVEDRVALEGYFREANWLVEWI